MSGTAGETNDTGSSPNNAGQGSGGLPAIRPGPGGASLSAAPVAHPNFFAPIATLMSSIPTALEGQGPTGGAPRYVRIARLRSFLMPVRPQNEKLAKVIADGVGYFITGMAYVLKYALKLNDLLIQGDAGKALLETALKLAYKVTEDDFLNAIEDLNNNLLEGQTLKLGGPDGPMAQVGKNIKLAERYISFIPEPRDLEVIGQQLYSMMVIEWVAVPADKSAETKPVDMAKTGKLRLMLWALNKPFEPLDPGTSPDVMKITTLGQRRLWQPDAAKLPASSMGEWQGPEANSVAETIFETRFGDAPASPDVRELQVLLKAYGYPLTAAADGVFDAATATGVAQFQKLNGLAVNGEVDLPTVNQLFHLRYDPDQAKGRMRRAKRYSATELGDFKWPKP